MRMPSALLSIALLLPAGVARAEPAPAPAPLARDPRVAQALALLEAWAGAEQAYKRLPGVSMAVVHDQELLWSRGFGFADVEAKVPATAATMYSVCSISKLFTSVAVMQQRDAGRLRLDDPVSSYLPWLKTQGQEGAPPVTVFGLLTHSSGLPREVDIPYWAGPVFPFPTRDAVVAKSGEVPMLYRPEVHFQYSNLGLTLAGEVAAAAAGKPWSELVTTGILDPLGMKDTETDHADRWRGNRLAAGYSGARRDGTREKVSPYQLRGIAPAAGVTSTVEDLGLFASWQFRTLALPPGRLEVLSGDTLREMQRVHWMEPDWKTSWGLGFQVWLTGERTFVGHGGDCPGYRSQLLVETAGRVAAVFMTNTNGVDARAWAQRAWDVVAPAVKDAKGAPAGAKAPDPALARYVGRYDDWTFGEVHVLAWDGSLALVPLPTDDPVKVLVKLKPSGEHRFRRIRDDGELGEEIRFEVGPDGVPVRLWRHSYYATRADAAK